jgi:magnesium transporter
VSRLFRKSSKSAGLVPGTLVHIGKERTEEVTVTVINYSPDSFEENKVNNFTETLEFKGRGRVNWISVGGVHDTRVIQNIGKGLDVHPLVLEDIVNTTQRPKYEDFGSYIFVVLKILYYDTADRKLDSEQVSLILGSDFVISFQENKKDVFEEIRERIRKNKGVIRKKKADYLAYSLIDSIVDSYFLVLESIADNTEDIEKSLLTKLTPQSLRIIQELKRDIIFLRKAVWPLREVAGRLEKRESSLIDKSTGVFFRDVYDHTVQVMENTETLRDIVSGMADLYLSTVNNKMNEVMKTLTIIATIFIPLTFIAGIYGMNFDTKISRFNMPELGFKYGYFFVLSVMAVMSLLMVFYFRRKKWL